MIMRINDPERPLTLCKFAMVCPSNAKKVILHVVQNEKEFVSERLNTELNRQDLNHCDHAHNKLSKMITKKCKFDILMNVWEKCLCNEMSFMLNDTYKDNGKLRIIIFDHCCKNNNTLHWLEWLLNELYCLEKINMLTLDHDKLTPHEKERFLSSLLYKKYTVKNGHQLTKRCNRVSISMYVKMNIVIQLLKNFSVIEKEHALCQILTAKATWFAINRSESRSVHCAAAEGSKVKYVRINVEHQKLIKKWIFLLRMISYLYRIMKKWNFYIHGILENTFTCEKKVIFKVNDTNHDVHSRFENGKFYHDHNGKYTMMSNPYMSKWPT